MPLYNINVASEINATFVTYCGGFNCNICNITSRDFIYTPNISFTATNGRRKNCSYFIVPSFLSKTETTIALCVRKIKKRRSLLVIVPTVVVAVETGVDDSLESSGMVCLLLCFLVQLLLILPSHSQHHEYPWI